MVPVGEFNTLPIPLSSNNFHSADGRVNWGYQGEIQLPLQNMGGGVALNVHCILYGPEAPHNLQFVCQDFVQKGAGVTCLCEEGLVKGTLTSQSERRKYSFKSEQGGSLCNTIAYLLHDERGMRVGMPVSVY
jgi:hypothetical protein